LTFLIPAENWEKMHNIGKMTAGEGSGSDGNPFCWPEKSGIYENYGYAPVWELAERSLAAAKNGGQARGKPPRSQSPFLLLSS
jgi:hypothetical protein